MRNIVKVTAPEEGHPEFEVHSPGLKKLNATNPIEV